jgi:hypothetical protein
MKLENSLGLQNNNARQSFTCIFGILPTFLSPEGLAHRATVEPIGQHYESMILDLRICRKDVSASGAIPGSCPTAEQSLRPRDFIGENIFYRAADRSNDGSNVRQSGCLFSVVRKPTTKRWSIGQAGRARRGGAGGTSRSNDLDFDLGAPPHPFELESNQPGPGYLNTIMIRKIGRRNLIELVAAVNRVATLCS